MAPLDSSRDADRRLLLEANVAAIANHRELLDLVSHHEPEDRASLVERVSVLLGINGMQADAVLSMQVSSFTLARLGKLQSELQELG